MRDGGESTGATVAIIDSVSSSSSFVLVLGYLVKRNDTVNVPV
jgi:hypothetical protein